MKKGRCQLNHSAIQSERKHSFGSTEGVLFSRIGMARGDIAAKSPRRVTDLIVFEIPSRLYPESRRGVPVPEAAEPAYNNILQPHDAPTKKNRRVCSIVRLSHRTPKAAAACPSYA